MTNGPPRLTSPNDHADGHTHTADARLTAHDFRIHGNSVEL